MTESALVDPVTIEDADVGGLGIQDVDLTAGTEGQTGNLAEELGPVAVRGAETETLPENGLLLPGTGVGAPHHDTAGGQGVDGTGPRPPRGGPRRTRPEGRPRPGCRDSVPFVEPLEPS